MEQSFVLVQFVTTPLLVDVNVVRSSSAASVKYDFVLLTVNYRHGARGMHVVEVVALA